MLDMPEAVFDGVTLLEKFIPDAQKFVFGIESFCGSAAAAENYGKSNDKG